MLLLSGSNISVPFPLIINTWFPSSSVKKIKSYSSLLLCPILWVKKSLNLQRLENSFVCSIWCAFLDSSKLSLASLLLASNQQVCLSQQKFLISTTVVVDVKQFCPVRYFMKCGWKYHSFTPWTNCTQDVYAGISYIFILQNNFTVSSPSLCVFHRPVTKHTHFAWFMRCFSIICFKYGSYRNIDTQHFLQYILIMCYFVYSYL